LILHKSGGVMQNLSVYYYSALIVIFVIGVQLLRQMRPNKGQAYMKFRRSVLKHAKEEMRMRLDDPVVSRLLFESGLHIDSVKYNTYRLGVLCAYLMSQIVIGLSEGVFSVKKICLAVTIFLLFSPIDIIWGYKTPFGFALTAFKNYRKDQIDKEIFETMTQLKNLCIAQAQSPLSGDYLIEQLLKFSRLTKPAFTKLLSLWRLGQSEKGCEVFADLLDTKVSQELSNIFLKLESMNPVELANHLELFQNHVREERMSHYLRKQETLSYVLYAPVIASAFMIMLNFMVIVIWMDTMQLIRKI